MKQTVSMVETFQVITEVTLEAKVMQAFVGEDLSEHCAAHSTLGKMVTLKISLKKNIVAEWW